MKRFWLVGFLVFSLQALTQEGLVKGDLSLFLEGGYLIGGQVTSNTFLYQSGVTSRVGISKEINQHFDVGIGMGVDTYDFIEFFPAFLRLEAKSNLEKNGMFVSHVGYSFAHSKDHSSVIEQEFGGGFFLELGRNWNYRISENISLTTGLSLKHQFAVLELENQIGEDLEEIIDFDSIHFRIGINIK